MSYQSISTPNKTASSTLLPVLEMKTHRLLGDPADLVTEFSSTRIAELVLKKRPEEIRSIIVTLSLQRKAVACSDSVPVADLITNSDRIQFDAIIKACSQILDE